MGTRRSALVLTIAWAIASCTGASTTPPQPPTEASARVYLATVVAIVQTGDLSHLCDLGSGTCRHILANGDPAAVPRTEPIVVGTRVITPTRTPAGAWDVGGRVLELCGRDGLGHLYYSEMLVFSDGSKLTSTVPVYWLGFRIASSPTTGSEPSPPPCPGI
jgi:hypothetical protein